MDITSTILDDYVVINNLEEFKIQLRVQQSYCNEVQIEMKRIQARLMKREKKYHRIKTENEQLHKRIIELERDVINTKDFFQRYMMLAAAPIPSQNCIQMISMSAPPASAAEQSSLISATSRFPPVSNSRPVNMGMHSVITELKNKFNNKS
jgi:predicted nuclease with TOPRIM domain